jgi:Uncharacterized conserved protein
MITIETLKHLEDRVIATNNPTIHNMTNIPFTFLPEKIRAESLEKLDHAPAQFRDIYKTHHTSNFVNYIKTHHSKKKPKPRIFIDQKTMITRTILDLNLHTNPN